MRRPPSSVLLIAIVLLVACRSHGPDQTRDPNLSDLQSAVEFDNGIEFNGIGLNGTGLNGIRINGIGLNGINLNGIGLNGIGLNGIGLNGINLNGIGLNGLYLDGIAFNGVDFDSLRINGIDLNGRNLAGIDLARINFDGIGLSGAGAVKPFLQTLAECALSCAQCLTVTDLDGSSLNYCGVEGIDPAWQDQLPDWSRSELMAQCVLDRGTMSGHSVNHSPVQLAAFKTLLAYLVSCALPSGDSITYTDELGVDQTLPGHIGAAPEWKSGQLSADGQRALTGCLMARTNALGTAVQISMRGTASGYAVSGQETSEFAAMEGAYWGDLWNTGECNALYACTAYAFRSSNGRMCSSNTDNCGFHVVGPCEQYCELVVDGDNRYWSNCTTDEAVQTPCSSSGDLAVTTYLRADDITDVRHPQPHRFEITRVFIQAESFTFHKASTTHSWDFTKHDSDQTVSLRATPNIGTSLSLSQIDQAPRLDYRVHFPNAGTVYLAVRARKQGDNDAAGNTIVHFGINGTPVGTIDFAELPGTGHKTRELTTTGTDAALTIPTAGVHTVNLWMGDDGLYLDAIGLHNVPRKQVWAENEAGKARLIDEIPLLQRGAAEHHVLVFEAEHFDHAAAAGAHSWNSVSFANDTRYGCVQALPNSGATIDADIAQASPRLDYRLYFTHTGTHYVYVRGQGEGLDDSFHIGLDGVVHTQNIAFNQEGSPWRWANGLLAAYTIDVPTTGIHTMNVWMREDGVVLDKFVITPSTTADPIAQGAKDGGAHTGPSLSRRAMPPQTPYLSRLHRDTDEKDSFGGHLVVSGNRLFVGAQKAHQGAIKRVGAVRVYEDTPGGWVQDEFTELWPPTPHQGDHFGSSVAAEGDTLVVGARYSDEVGKGNGVGFVFEWDAPASTWNPVTTLRSTSADRTLSGGGVAKQCGRAAAIFGDQVALTCAENGERNGVVLLYQRDTGGAWSEFPYAVLEDPRDPVEAVRSAFGRRLDFLNSNVIVVGAYTSRSPEGNGAAYVFNRSGSVWTHSATLEPADAYIHDRFGHDISCDGDRCLIGASGKGSQFGQQTGAAYVFYHDGTSFTEEAKLVAPDGTLGDAFGWSVALKGTRAVVVAPFEHSVGTGAGAFYVFERSGTTWAMVSKFDGGDPASIGGGNFGQDAAINDSRVVLSVQRANLYPDTDGAVYVYDLNQLVGN